MNDIYAANAGFDRRVVAKNFPSGSWGPSTFSGRGRHSIFRRHFVALIAFLVLFVGAVSGVCVGDDDPRFQSMVSNDWSYGTLLPKRKLPIDASCFSRVVFERALVRHKEAPQAVQVMWRDFRGQLLDQHTLAVFANSAFNALAPPWAIHGRSVSGLELLATTVLVMRTLLDLQDAFNRIILPIWCRKIGHALLPSWYEGIPSGDPQFYEHIASLISGGIFAAGAVAYALFTKRTFYAGKAAVMRSAGRLGLPARVGEHLRCLLRPRSRDAQKPRCKLLAAIGILSLRWLPLIACLSVSMALAAETIVIDSLEPDANRQDEKTERRMKGVAHSARYKGERRRPSSWNRRKLPRGGPGNSPTSLWEQWGVKLAETPERRKPPENPLFNSAPYHRLYKM